MISQVESGKAKPSLDLILEVAKRLEVDADYFFVDKKPSMDALSLCLVNVYLSAKQYERAAYLLRSLINTHGHLPESLDFLIDYTLCCLNLGRLDEAEKYLNFMGDHDEPATLARLLHYRGLLHFHAKRYDKAIFVWNKSLSLLDEPNRRTEILLLLTQAYAKLGNQERVLEIIEQAIPYAESGLSLKDQANQLIKLAKTLHKQGDYKQSIHYADHAKHLNDVHRNLVEAACNRVAIALLKAKEQFVPTLLETSIKRFEKLKSPEAGAKALQLALHLLYLGDEPATVAAIQRAKPWIPDESPFREKLESILALLDAKQGRKSGEKQLHEQANRHFSSNRVLKWGDAISHLAWIRADKNKFGEACDLLLSVRNATHEKMQANGIRFSHFPTQTASH
ncbi:hypothetical protein EL26_21075 [Tumebacillus flagellatus]|uniref:HTH cro/C1-type domain-containing protein n=2 Tax=Tumebacillus flagellatus TaxID=1157490 RepID=A0A074LJY8_9BACL|nr:hypothetical protein EL26_21075 [Tumebacillus flagellatus]